MSYTAGYTTTPTGGTFSVAGNNGQGAAEYLSSTPAGAAFQISVHVFTFDGNSHTMYACIWTGAGHLRANASFSSQFNAWYNVNLASPLVIPSGQQYYVGFQCGSFGYTVQHDSGGTSYRGNTSSSPPVDMGFGSSGFGDIGAYYTYNIAPTITSFSPGNGGVGTTVTITGTEYTTVSSVDFNGTSASFTVNSDTQITATVPTGATTGPIHVTNPMGTATSATNYIVAGGYVNTGTLAVPVWTATSGVYINTGTLPAPVWTQVTEVAVNTNTLNSPTWTPGG